MTTVVYNHETKEIGIDSRLTMGNFIESDDYIKMIEKEDLKFFLCGDLADSQMLARCYPNNIEYEIGSSAYGFLVQDGIVKYIYTEGLIIKELIQTNSSAVGSGFQFAISALDLGKSTKEALEYAMTRDNGSGGKIRIYNVEEL